jgi:hypothetical protein
MDEVAKYAALALKAKSLSSKVKRIANVSDPI